MAIHLNIDGADAREFLHDLKHLAGPLVERCRDSAGDLTGDIDLDDGTWERVGDVYVDRSGVTDAIRVITGSNPVLVARRTDQRIAFYRRRS